MQLNAVFSDIEFRRWSRIVALTWLEFLEASVSALTIVSSLIITFTSNTSWKGLLWHDGSALDRYEDFVATKLGNVNSACFHETAFQRPLRKICVEWLYFRDSETREITFPVENQTFLALATFSSLSGSNVTLVPPGNLSIDRLTVAILFASKLCFSSREKINWILVLLFPILFT